jgi:hypothetical protein
MRVNIYNEELTDRVKFLTRTVEATGATFYGIRFHLASPKELHNSQGDDDTPAVTFFADNTEKLTKLLTKALEVLKNKP